MEIFNEASQLSPVEKMQELNAGKYRNVAAMSDAKLRLNRQICINNNLPIAQKQIEAEMKKRNLLGNAQAANVTDNSANSVPHHLLLINKNLLQDETFILSIYNNSKEILDDVQIIADFDPEPIAESKIFTMLTIGVILKNKLVVNKAKTVLNNIFKVSDGDIKLALARIQNDGATISALTTHINKTINNINNVSSVVIHEDIEVHDTLNKKIWTDSNTLKPEVEEKIHQIVDEFIAGLLEDNISIKVDDIILIGSNCSYNYTKDSDLDIHIVADLSASKYPEDCTSKLYSAYRTIFNKDLDIEFYGIPVEIFVEDANSIRISNGVYSVMNSTWIKEPSYEDIPEINKDEFDKEFNIWEAKYHELLSKILVELKA